MSRGGEVIAWRLSKNTTHVATYIPIEQKARLEEIAIAEDTSVSRIVKLAIAEYIKRRMEAGNG